ncbi:5-enolpyruvylshikimate-3-phosphate synthase [Nonlabens ulvanivorans]|nr:3-phosphoshikimate 1-carboxyvinyltransferase [Nonlabens ulvanivorans]GAK92903.1 5-enolpyruvylshikimate-3-phosphate synthase [Nonlabens ulvanivorans]
MDLLLEKPLESLDKDLTFTITGSKSESNRLLILKALYPELEIVNLSNSDDTVHMQEALMSQKNHVDIGHAGTAMRFLTAYYSSKKGLITITGSQRMQQRPIAVLVDALRSIGAKIQYLNQEGYPPLKIDGGHINGATVKLDASVSSQYITALMLIAPSLENGLKIELIGKLTSRPYIQMTVRHLQSIGVTVNWSKQDVVSQKDIQASSEVIQIKPLETIINKSLTVESDWSSAGYWYSWVALQDIGYKLILQYYFKDSVQGDSKLSQYYEAFGVQTSFDNNQLILTKKSDKVAQRVVINLVNEPDQAQTIFATCLALGVDAHLTGLHTLRIKETDRIAALKDVGSRFRESVIETTQDTITLTCEPLVQHDEPVVIDTFDDHRMAMAFAPVACRTSLLIKDAGVVTKSYPQFWDDLKRVNVNITEI